MEVVLAQSAEDPGGIVFEFEIVFRRGGEFVANDIEREFMSGSEVVLCERTFDLCLTS